MKNAWKTLFAGMLTVLIGFTFAIADAEAARRLGGGKSMGMQRDSTKPATPPAASPTQAAPAAANPGMPAATPKRSWMGPLAGLAAGLGLAALASHFGFGEELASFLLIGLLAMVAVAVVGMILRRRSGAAPGIQRGMQYAAAGPAGVTPLPTSLAGTAGGSAPSTAVPSSAARIPAGFDAEGFARQAKLNFIRLQAANDAGNLDDIREFTSPEMFAEIKMQIGERGGATQHTDVQTINAEILEVAEETSRYIVSVRFTGLLREDNDAAAAPFDEIWHLVKPTDGSRGWVVAGIQQTQ